MNYSKNQSHQGGGHGILCPLFSEVRSHARDITKLLAAQRIVAFLLLLVVAGRFGTLGINFSTVSAQPAELAASTPPGGPTIGRRRRNRGDEPAEWVAASYSRYSSELQKEDSIPQQQKKCRERAEANKHRIIPELEFADEAISGTLLGRDGFHAMLKAAEEGKFAVLYLFSLSRLARDSLLTMTTLKRLVYVYRVRVVCVAEGIDTSAPGWELQAQVHAIMDEHYIRNLRVHVLRGLEDNQLKDYSNGDFCVGYRSEPIPGTEKSRKGRDSKPRMRIVIDPAQAAWVKKIFHWYVRDHKSLSWIARELTKLKVPKDHRDLSKGGTSSSSKHCYEIPNTLDAGFGEFGQTFVTPRPARFSKTGTLITRSQDGCENAQNSGSLTMKRFSRCRRCWTRMTLNVPSTGRRVASSRAPVAACILRLIHCRD